jgi:hypothetical protein
MRLTNTILKLAMRPKFQVFSGLKSLFKLFLDDQKLVGGLYDISEISIK